MTAWLEKGLFMTNQPPIVQQETVVASTHPSTVPLSSFFSRQNSERNETPKEEECHTPKDIAENDDVNVEDV